MKPNCSETTAFSGRIFQKPSSPPFLPERTIPPKERQLGKCQSQLAHHSAWSQVSHQLGAKGRGRCPGVSLVWRLQDLAHSKSMAELTSWFSPAQIQVSPAPLPQAGPEGMSIKDRPFTFIPN
ncbi:hypothetical protein P7K49_035792 [Saguinus oedipus]|uniref:Uncharacterized protein n=1 Tax=Saguinus oedipus TaxID=9490 RepID=A0ABQ9TNL5_SAGOE|nr:hypothetical protein P7K49_035792 [Saguinus oedipus]